jgi:hypothetical protein
MNWLSAAANERRSRRGAQPHHQSIKAADPPPLELLRTRVLYGEPEECPRAGNSGGNDAARR